MSETELTTPVCPIHGSKLKRATCLRCNAAYMAAYQRRRRRSEPALALLERARRRAKRAGIHFRLDRSDISLPPTCPAFGTPLVVGQPRSGASPSLDRVEPKRGYVPGNVRVVCDAANRLKSDLTLDQLEARARGAKGEQRDAYLKLSRYVERELLLQEVRTKAKREGREGEVWAELASALERLFSRGR